ncbi:hypothetical protein TRFO_19541 [Tritrichomonas foetus]|uniref:Uncharacterized protein n=1 Tax=Tritrichomonas foetus TaxID=1144522 RepID=A0A1J4KMD9_9EUKA|nr:hypothetical protein TRFO_19541 [Tritrichomonas foetus]|eukprot:OHT10964.1 hypothetical protein TRFO_19541 [Tritrichomonas foetus]
MTVHKNDMVKFRSISSLCAFKNKMYETDDKRLQEWIQRDLAENMALSEFQDEDNALSSQPKSQNTLLPKFRIEGKTNKFKSRKQKEIISIPETKIQQLKDMMVQIEEVTKQIEQEKKKIAILQGSNAQSHRELLETKQRLSQIKTEVEDTKLAHLKKLEEVRLVQEKVKKEEDRSRKARSKIAQKKIQAEEELKSLEKEFNDLQADYKEFKRKRKTDKQKLEAKVAETKLQNSKLKEQLHQIEIELAKAEW